MVVEFPNQGCTTGAQHRGDMQEAREALVKGLLEQDAAA